MRYGIGALSRDTGCKIETIRYYERIGLLPEPPRSAGGHRSYEAEHTQILNFILRSRRIGFSLDETRQLLALSKAEACCESVQTMTKKHITAIRQRAEELERIASRLQTLADQCPDNGNPHCPIIDTLFSQTQPA